MLAVQRKASYSQKVLASCLNRVVEDRQWLSKMLAYGRSQAWCCELKTPGTGEAETGRSLGFTDKHNLLGKLQASKRPYLKTTG